MTEINKWITIDSQLVLDHQWCRVRKDRVKLSNGVVVDDYFVNVRPDIALVLPITKKQEIVFVQQYRHGVEQILLELPAGSFNPQKEDSLVAAQRELLEETGYVVGTIAKIATLYDNPVKDTNKIHLFLATDVAIASKQNLDITEAIKVILIPISELKNRILQGEICVSGSIAAIFLGLEIYQRNF